MSLLNLKTGLLTLLAVFTLASALRAESAAPGKQKVGISLLGGFAFSNNQYNGPGTLSGFPGLAFGAGVDYRITPTLTFGIEALYVSKGHVIELNGTKTKSNLSYVEFPIQLKWSPIPQFMLHLGPYLAALMVSADVESNGISTPAKSQFNNDFGMTGGAWVGFWNTPSLALGVDVRYDVGLADVLNDNQPANFIHTRSLLSLMTLVLGF